MAPIKNLPPVNFVSDAYIQNPYPIQKFYREEAPFFWSGDDRSGVWWVSSYEDIVAIYRDLRFRNGSGRVAAFAQLTPELREKYKYVEEMIARWLLLSDGAKHTRMRKLMNAGFTNKQLRQLAEFIERTVDTLLDEMEAKAEDGVVDFINMFAEPLPAIVITEMLSIPQTDRGKMIDWIEELTVIIGLGRLTPEKIASVAKACDALTEYLIKHLDDLRQNPRDSALQAMLDAEIDGDRLSQEELISQASLMYFGGNGTTKDLLGNGMHLLLKHTDQLAKLKANPDLRKSAIEEMLRMEPSIQFMGRTIQEDFEFQDRPFKKGQLLFAVNAAANRDPKVFEDPETFNIERSPNKHLSFGIGTHFCLGANLSRLEADIAFRKLLERFPDIHLIDQPIRYQPTPIFRSLESLKVKLYA